MPMPGTVSQRDAELRLTPITNVNNQTLNLAFTKTQGVDMELGYKFGLADLVSSASGTMSLRLLGTYVDKSNENNGIVTVDRAGQVGNSHWRMTGSANYANGPWSGYLQLRFIEAAKVDNTFTPNDIYDNTVPTRIYLNGSVQYTVFDSESAGRLQIFGHVNNLLDKSPPYTGGGISGASAQYHDTMGRAYRMGVRLKF